jgi:phage terminase large subunit-like protein
VAPPPDSLKNQVTDLLAMAENQRNFVAIALEYAQGAVSDRLGHQHCKWVRLACQRHLDDLERSEGDPAWPYEFDPWRAADVCDFIEKMPHVEGEWDSPTIELEPWQIFIQCSIFGWRRRSDGGRRFSMVYEEVARKNAKSTRVAANSLYGLSCEGEPGAQIYIGATTGDQAGKVFNPANQMVRRTPDLREAFGLEPYSRAITCAENGGFIRPINAKSSTQDGHNPHWGILDELHAHKDRGLFDVVRSAKGARRNPLLWMITTAGTDMVGVCYEQRELVTKILEGLVPMEHYFGIIYTLDGKDEAYDGAPADDAFDEDCWIKANPNLDVSVNRAELQEMAAEAKLGIGKSNYLTKRMNIWLNAPNQWIPMPLWDEAADPSLNIEDFEGEPCWIGLDLSDTDDITAKVRVFEREGVIYAFPTFYLPEELVRDLASSVGGHYAKWADDGALTLTPGNWIDHDQVEEEVRADCDRFGVMAIRFDLYGAATAMSSRLETAGHNSAVLPKRTVHYTDPANDLIARLKVGRFRHDANPCFRWMASNVIAQEYGDKGILPKKDKRNPANKIDGIDALLLGLHPLLAEEKAEPKPVPMVSWV